ncbi:glycosyltransferase family 4 protein [Brunnivagina elsteri]|uniref:Glycosyltransferase family 1 protein n=1 Tax=Brunnivagina elsteri CCALA 953 TaxID=987040 RepID=A0A2A2TNI5_9CYAN|nr:glycosyltransferase family 4 protein [Calothrix elsteri]PAX60013.1 glycosyltransferase family 1 protein [Calothrix elsteri CCALA 953]
MKKILMVTTIPATLKGFLLPFARHFRNRGWQVDAMASGVSTCATCQELFDQVWEVEWSRNPLDPRNLMTTPNVIQDVVRQEHYDIVHVHTPVAAFVTRYALRNLRKQLRTRVIYTAHGFHFHPGGKALKNSLFLALEKFAGSWNDYLVVINRDDEQAAKRYWLNPPERVRYMPGIGVDAEYYNPNAISTPDVERVRQEMGINADTSLFLSVAEFNPGKRHRDIIHALAKLNRDNICIAFAGTGPLMGAMQQLASELGVENQVKFLGFRKDITTLICASVATILASEREGLPRSIMESLCLEVPVIGAEIRGIRDLVTQDCGYLFPVGDIQALADSIAMIADNPQKAQIMGKKGRDRMAAFELRQVIDLHEKLYTEALSA